MKKSKLRVFSVLLVVAILGCSTIAFADDSIEGESSGGSAGIANCKGRITLRQGYASIGDSVTAYTSADATGTYGVAAVVWYNDGVGEKSKYEDKIVNNATAEISVISIAPNINGNKGTGGHTYTSTIRGSWTGGTSKAFN